MFLKLYLPLMFIASISASSLEYDGWLHINLYHAIDMDLPNKFTPRGNVTISSLNSGSFTIVQEPLSNNERIKIKKLAENDKVYRLKAVVSGQDGEEATFLTYSRACALAASQLTDSLWVSLNHLGHVLGVSQSISGTGNCRDQSFNHQVDALEEFNTDVFVKHTELAPIPDTASFIQKMEREREARERGDVKDNRGFLAKYWMYLLPVVVLVLLSGASNPEGGGGGAR
ncbi:ER membrane protein complex subunit 10 [Pseudolycoriella hygida]|uniref:ER membrane protein complex subunit 10 n=1 Tax=Pseudolycoriella hygida TaxID=35572 RepID=A0A9Q0S837_9DIPT|nr:ER membrane protein complex subunit 10 [Pseudolycoriella hygida]